MSLINFIGVEDFFVNFWIFKGSWALGVIFCEQSCCEDGNNPQFGNYVLKVETCAVFQHPHVYLFFLCAKDS